MIIALTSERFDMNYCMVNRIISLQIFSFLSFVHSKVLFSVALGFEHMHSHINRDRYIKILWENIKPGTEINFQMRRSQYGYDYDYYSVMHYNAYGFSKNGQPTIVPYVRDDLNFFFI